MKVTFTIAMLLCSYSGRAQNAWIASQSQTLPAGYRPFSAIGMESHVGVGGIGFDLATPIARNFNLRAGSEFFGYSSSFQEQGANVVAHLRMQSARASLDWFPFGGGFRVSPLVAFANDNRAQATAIIPPGGTFVLNGVNYTSSTTDPLRGAGSVDFRKTSPGISVGWGNIVPRGGRHFTFPVEAGFYYVGQPGLKVSFSGSACVPNLPAGLPAGTGCEAASQDPDFQQSLAAFIARNNHNLSYASYFPIFSVGFGYSFSPRW